MRLRGNKLLLFWFKLETQLLLVSNKQWMITENKVCLDVFRAQTFQLGKWEFIFM